MQLGRYEVLRKLGEGGMARVLLARSVATGAQVVLKVPFTERADFAERVRDEARVGLRVHHPSVVDTLDLFEHDGRPILVVEYVEGATLQQLRRQGGAMPPGLVARLGRQVAEGLAFLHEATDESEQPLHILHRDVTPANVIVTAAGNAKLIDLGIARGLETKARKTQVGTVRGTARYLAPELLAGEKHTAATDLWALGVVLFEAALGRRAAEGDERDVLAAIARGAIGELRPGESLDPTLADGVFALLAPADRRLQRARAAANVLKRLEAALPADDDGWLERTVADVLARQHARWAAEDPAPGLATAATVVPTPPTSVTDPRPRVNPDQELGHDDGAAPTVRMSATELDRMMAVAPTELMPAVEPGAALEVAEAATRLSAVPSSPDRTQKFPRPGPAHSPATPDSSSSLAWRSVAAPSLLSLPASDATPPGASVGFPRPVHQQPSEPVIAAEPDEKTEAGAPPPSPPSAFAASMPSESGAARFPVTRPASEPSGPLPRMLRVADEAFPTEVAQPAAEVPAPAATAPPPSPPSPKPVDPAHRAPDPRALGIPTPMSVEAAREVTVPPDEPTESAFDYEVPDSLPSAASLSPREREPVVENTDRTMRVPPAPRAGFIGQRADPDDDTERVERWAQRRAIDEAAAGFDEPLLSGELAWKPKRGRYVAVAAGVVIAVGVAIGVVVLLS